MKRRDFNKLLIAGTGISVMSCAVPKTIQNNVQRNGISKIKPKMLKKGDTVGLVAPGSAFSDKAYKSTIENLENIGLKYKKADNLFSKYGYVAGTDKQRVDDLHQMFSDKEVDAIWCVRGGYGTTRFLDDLDYDLIKRNPKIIVGYSDITALLQAIHVKTGLITFHGPVGSSELTPYTLDNFKKVLFERNNRTVIKIFDSDKKEDVFVPSIIVEGAMQGELVGGNLSLLSAISGTDFTLDLTDKILFVEDIGEKPYRIDRMLTQLIYSTQIKKASGIVCGVFNDCDVEEGTEGTLRLKETIKDRLADLGIPVFYGFSFGHIKDMCTLPVGIEARFDMDEKEFILLENAVV